MLLLKSSNADLRTFLILSYNKKTTSVKVIGAARLSALVKFDTDIAKCQISQSPMPLNAGTFSGILTAVSVCSELVPSGYLPAWAGEDW